MSQLGSCSPGSSLDKSRDTRKRLEKCWSLDLDWDLYPTFLREGCWQLGKAISVPPTAILGGLLILTSFVISPAVINVPKTDWIEPTLIWLTINMPTGSRKTTVYQLLLRILQQIRQAVNLESSSEPIWLLQDATFEKMGALMAQNGGRLCGMFDELTALLTKLKLYSNRGLSDSHELAMFLELYNGNSWTRSTVTGEANFSMDRTSLTVGGFNQPAVARFLLEMPGNAEKGLSQRFLWLFPKPVYGEFKTLEPSDKKFTDKIVAKLAKLWKKSTVKEIPTTAYYLPDDETQMATFTQKYDEVQKQLQTIAAMDDLLSGVRHIAIQITSSFSNIIGMLSKSLGQTLRISVAMHILFHNDDDGDELSNTVTQAAVEAAINFVEVCCQHTAYIAGRNDINEQLKLFETGTIVESPTIQKSTESFVLTLPGQCLDVSMLVNIKKRFRKRGGREGALQAMRELMKDGMGELKEKKNKGSIKTWEFHKKAIPDDLEGKTAFGEKLAKYEISLLEYSKSMEASMERGSAHNLSNTTAVATPTKSPRRSSAATTPSKRLKL